jgi:hypothetical protein
MSSNTRTTGQKPECLEIAGVRTSKSVEQECPTIFWRTANNIPVTEVLAEYSPKGGDGKDSRQCNVTDQNCTLGGLISGTSYTVTLTAINNCGNTRAMGCTMNTMIVTANGSMCFRVQMRETTSLPPEAIGGIVVAAAFAIAAATTTVITIVICCCCPAVLTWFVATCCCCCTTTSASSKQSRPAKLHPSEEYADSQTVRNTKEKRKEDKGITYAALEFSEQAGSTGKASVRSKSEPVQYMAVEHA